METMTDDVVVAPEPAPRPKNRMICGFCGGAPVTRGDQEAAHARCPGPEHCICNEDDHRPTERVLIAQAGYCFWDYRLTGDVAEMWPWAPEAIEVARGIKGDKLQRLQEKAQGRSAGATRRRIDLRQESGSAPEPMSPSSSGELDEPAGSRAKAPQTGHDRTLSPIEQIAAQLDELADIPAENGKVPSARRARA